jgi:hypothetical protein
MTFNSSHREERARAHAKAHEEHVRDLERRMDEYGDDLLRAAGEDPEAFRVMHGLPTGPRSEEAE